MRAVVAFVSQKGGVGKSTLARSLGVVAAQAGHNVKIADLDGLQQTLVRWTQTREAYGISPSLRAETYADTGDACAASVGADLLVLDTPGKVNELMHVVQRANLLVLPTSPSLDDLYPSVLVCEALQNVGITRDCLAFALSRVLSEREGESARTFLVAQGYTVLAGHLYEHLAYREALNAGRGLTETQDEHLNRSAQLVMNDVLQRVGLYRDGMSPIQALNFRNIRSAPSAS